MATLQWRGVCRVSLQNNRPGAVLNSSQWRNTSGWGCLGRLPIRGSTLNFSNRLSSFNGCGAGHGLQHVKSILTPARQARPRRHQPAPAGVHRRADPPHPSVGFHGPPPLTIGAVGILRRRRHTTPLVPVCLSSTILLPDLPDLQEPPPGIRRQHGTCRTSAARVPQPRLKRFSALKQTSAAPAAPPATP